MTAEVAGASFDMGRVPSATFTLLRGNFVNFFSLAVVLSGIPTLVVSAVSLSFLGVGANMLDTAALGARALTWFVGFLVQLAGIFLLQAAVVNGAISDLNGRRMDLREMLLGRLSVVPILLLLAIVQGLAEVAGFLVFLVPGIILACMWAVSVPAAVVEKAGVFGALSRSAELTKGHRWAVFGLAAAYFIAMAIVDAVLRSVVFGFSLGALANPTAIMAAQSSVAMLCFTAAYAALSGVVGATGIAVIYYELRRAREGVAPQALIDTFS